MQADNDLSRIVRINEDIKSVVRLARKINILALNAILLSRKAGHVAIGFGVIADELRIFSRGLTSTMQDLMSISYGSIGIVSQCQRQSRRDRLLEATSDSLDAQRLTHRKFVTHEDSTFLNLHRVFSDIRKLLVSADDSSRFGSVIARSLKIEATYGGNFCSMLTQIALEFSHYIDAIPDLLTRIQTNLQGK